MASYKVIVSRSAEREHRQVPKRDLRRIATKMEKLAQDPTPPGSINWKAKNVTDSDKEAGVLSIKLITSQEA